MERPERPLLRHGPARHRGKRRRQCAPRRPPRSASCRRRCSSIRPRLPTRTSPRTPLDAARQVVRSLNDGTTAIQTFRSETDCEIATAVGELNTLLAEFKDANDLVIAGTRAGRDVSDALDRRDATLKKIAEYVPVTTFTRGDNDMVVMTKDGTTLFETVPRVGDLRAVAGPCCRHHRQCRLYRRRAGRVRRRQHRRPARSPAGAAARQRRHDHAEPARRSRARPDHRLRRNRRRHSPTRRASSPGRARPACRPAGTLVNGLAGSITLNAAIDTAQGGNADAAARRRRQWRGLCRQHRRRRLLCRPADRLWRPHRRADGLRPGRRHRRNRQPEQLLHQFHRLVRRRAQEAPTPRCRPSEALAVRTAEALSNDTGVNVDMEMSLLLDLEHSYQASARLINAVDDMLASLLAAVR